MSRWTIWSATSSSGVVAVGAGWAVCVLVLRGGTRGVRDLCFRSYSVKFERKMECGGAYVKLLTGRHRRPERFSSDAPYAVGVARALA